MSRAENDRMRRRVLAARQPLTCLAGRFRRRILGDDFLERLSCAAVVAELDLSARDVEQRIGHFLAVGERGEQLALGLDGGTKIFLRVLCVSGPIHRRRRQRTSRIAARESLEARRRRRIIATLELVERGVIRALLGGNVSGTPLRGGKRRRPRPSCHRKGGFGRPRRCGGPRSTLELAQTTVEIEVEIALPLL